MIRLTEEKILALHRLITDETGGDPSLRDAGLLDSALNSPYQTFGGCELYPTIEEKGARLGYSLIANHAFVDGNKRIGIFALLIFLKINGYKIAPSADSVTRVTLSVASGEASYDELLAWVRENKV